METIIQLDKSNIDSEHICCAFSDKKCKESYQLKKDWLTREFENGYVFKRIDARAKVFIEYVPAEFGWVPVDAPNYLLINCLWVSGQYKQKGYAKELLRHALEDASSSGRDGVFTIAGISKFHFMNDAKWFIKQGFSVCQTLPTGFSLLVKKIVQDAPLPQFRDSVLSGECPDKIGLVAYFSNRCPFAEFHVTTSLKESAQNRNLPLTVYKIDSLEQAQSACSPATIFSLFYNGKFVTTDLSACLDSRLDKTLAKFNEL